MSYVGDECLARGIDVPWRKFDPSDVDPALRSRFASGADFEIHACLVGGGDLPQTIADTWGVTVRATKHVTKFWNVRTLVWATPIEEVAKSQVVLVPVGPEGLAILEQPTSLGRRTTYHLLWDYKGEEGYHGEYVYQLPYEGSRASTRIRSYSEFVPAQ